MRQLSLRVMKTLITQWTFLCHDANLGLHLEIDFLNIISRDHFQGYWERVCEATCEALCFWPSPKPWRIFGIKKRSCHNSVSLKQNPWKKWPDSFSHSLPLSSLLYSCHTALWSYQQGVLQRGRKPFSSVSQHTHYHHHPVIPPVEQLMCLIFPPTCPLHQQPPLAELLWVKKPWISSESSRMGSVWAQGRCSPEESQKYLRETLWKDRASGLSVGDNETHKSYLFLFVC